MQCKNAVFGSVNEAEGGGGVQGDSGLSHRLIKMQSLQFVEFLEAKAN
jgi:hypothetical protein